MTAPIPIPGQIKSAVNDKGSRGGGGGGGDDTSGNVRVVGRVRPLAKYELDKQCRPVVTKVPNLLDPEGPETLQINQPEQRWFELDAVLDESCTQQEVYEKSGACKAISEDLFCGFNCTVRQRDWFRFCWTGYEWSGVEVDLPSRRCPLCSSHVSPFFLSFFLFFSFIHSFSDSRLWSNRSWKGTKGDDRYFVCF